MVEWLQLVGEDGPALKPKDLKRAAAKVIMRSEEHMKATRDEASYHFDLSLALSELVQRLWLKVGGMAFCPFPAWCYDDRFSQRTPSRVFGVVPLRYHRYCQEIDLLTLQKGRAFLAWR